MDEVKQHPDVGAAHLLPKEKRSKLPLILAGVAVLLIAAYAALCFWVSANGRILPNVQVGDSTVGGMTVAEAARQIESDANKKFSPCSIQLTYGTDGSVTVPGSYITADGHAASLSAYAAGRSASPVLYGLNFLKALTAPTKLELPITLNSGFPQGSSLLDNAFLGHETAPVQPEYTVRETEIQMRKGIPSYRYDREAVNQLLMQAIVDASNGSPAATVHVDPVRTEPNSIDWSALAAQVAVTPMDASIDPETKEVVPSVTGVSLDVAEAQRLYALAGEGDSLTIPLTITEPKITTQLLFRDVLGEVITWISGVENRLANVTMAAEVCNDIILMPGEEFSYWDTCGPFSVEQGYLPAPSYVNGETVDSIAGGVCQVSSSIYYSALKANLEIVERRNHTYAVGYVPDGADATVFSGSPDFRFKNSTEYPIRIVATTKGRNLTVQLQGTKTDDTYVKMQFVELSRTPYETIYKADPSIPVGTTEVSVTPYTGRKVEAYRCVYNGDGTLLSKTLESTNNYKKRDEIILCNPADLHLYDPTAPNPTPSPSISPIPSTTPEPSVSPAPTQSSPPPSAAVVPSETPAVGETPLPESGAVPSQPPAQPSPTPSESPADPLPETGEESQ